MSTTHPSVVVADSQKVVDGHTMLRVDHVLGHVQPLGKRSEKINICVTVWSQRYIFTHFQLD